MLAGLSSPTYVDPFDRVCLGLRKLVLPATTDLGGAKESVAQQNAHPSCVNKPTPPAPCSQKIKVVQGCKRESPSNQ